MPRIQPLHVVAAMIPCVVAVPQAVMAAEACRPPALGCSVCGGDLLCAGAPPGSGSPVVYSVPDDRPFPGGRDSGGTDTDKAFRELDRALRERPIDRRGIDR